MNINNAVTQLGNQLPREYRKAVHNALSNSDGTFTSFQAELSAQSWDYPDLPVQDILDNLVAFG